MLSAIEWPLLVGVCTHGTASLLLFGSLFAWSSIYTSGSRMGFALMMMFVNLAYTFLYAVRWIDGETTLRDDTMEVFAAREATHMITLLLCATAVCLYERFPRLSLTPSLALLSGSGGALFLWAALRDWNLQLSLMLLVLGLVAFALVVVQLLAWLLVPDTASNQGDVAHRRQDLKGVIMVALMAFYICVYAALELSSSTFANYISIDTALYEWLHVSTCTLPSGVALTTLGLLTYWDDVKKTTAVKSQ
jgi:hypothetical protein